MPTQIPEPVFGPNGIILPLESAVLTGAQADVSTALGGNVNMSLTTPQGQVASTISAIVANKNTQLLVLFNNFDPAFATGRMQDALGRIYFIDRIPSSSTVVTAQCAGVSGTDIPTGTYAVDTSNRLWISLQDATIDNSGSVNIQFQCLTTGPIVCPPTTLTTIYKGIDGWERITNANAGTIGRNVETAAEFENRRFNSVAVNSAGTVPAVRATVLAIDGVTDCYVTENDTSSALLVGAYSLNKNSIYVAVVGGNLSDIATAVWKKKSCGCGYTGNTPITVYDSASYYQQPYPSYTVTLSVPTQVPIYIDITLEPNDNIPSDAYTTITNVVINAFSGADGGTRATIRSLILASRYYAGILALGSWAQIGRIKVGVSSGDFNDIVQMEINQVPVISANTISVSLTTSTPVTAAASFTISDGSL